MTIEEAIKTAIQFEKKIHETYLGAARAANDETARKVFATLAQEEEGHVVYLESRLDEWQRAAHLSAEKLGTMLPSAERIKAGLARVHAQAARRKGNHGPDLEALRQALAAEEETSSFYRRMVLELPADGQDLFARFLEIEDGHSILVQAEIDNVSKLGFWFDVEEFNLEAG